MTTENKLIVLGWVGEINDLSKKILQTLPDMKIQPQEDGKAITDGISKLYGCVNKLMEAAK